MIGSVSTRINFVPVERRGIVAGRGKRMNYFCLDCEASGPVPPLYNLLSIGVCDDAGRLLGAITVDDVLDRTLPTGWRQRRRVSSEAVSR